MIYRFARNDKSTAARCLLCACLALSGCTWDQLNPFKPPMAPPPPVETFVLRTGGLVPQEAPKEKSPEALLVGARDLYRRQEYAKAEKIYHYVGYKEKFPASAIQEGLYYEAECLRAQGNLHKAADTYAKLMESQPSNPYKDQALRHLYEIAEFWLQDTWVELKEKRERRQGKRWIVWPRFVSFDKRKPILDREGCAVQRLQTVYTYEGSAGPYADKAHYQVGYIAWINEDFNTADEEFTALHDRFPNSPYAAEALEWAIKAKLMRSGGGMYDATNVVKARQMVDQALRMPGLSEEKKVEFQKLLQNNITKIQAEKDYGMAEFWRRTGHPGSAYFYYEIVRRRYPGTDPAKHAAERMNEIHAKMDKEQRQRLGDPPEGEGRPVESLGQPRRVDGQPEQAPPPTPTPAAPETAPPPRPLPPGIRGN